MRLVVGVGLLMVGCATKHHWVKPGGTVETKRVDRYECERDARSTFRERGETITEVDVAFYDRCMEARGWTKTVAP